MLFQKKTDFLPSVTSAVLGGVYTKEITREFDIESIYIKITAVSSGNIATATADGLLGLLKTVQLSVSDGSRTRNVVNCSGRGLLELANQYLGGLDRNTWAAKDVTSTSGNTYVLTYPIFCSHPQIMDPVGSTMLLPAPRYNQNPVLTLTLASQADVDSNGTPTFACSSITIDVIVNRRVRTILDLPVYDWELVELTQAYGSTGNRQLYELQVPGFYTGILMRAYTSATARGDVSVTGGVFSLELLGNVIRRFRLADVQIENDMSIFAQAATGAGSYFTGAYYLDFLTDKLGQDVSDLGSVLDANVAAGSGARLQLLQDITGGAGVQIKYLSHRILGDISASIIGKKAAAK